MTIKRSIWMISFVMAFILLLPFHAIHAEKQTVYVIPVEETVEKGLLAFINRSITEAEEQGADLIVLDINTPGGAVDAASEIGKKLTSTELPVIAFVNKNALSAGAYIALNADEIYMTPGSAMGSAAVIDQEGNAADQKAQSYWLSAMKSAAEQNGRDPQYALAMADKDINLPDLGAGKGKLLTLTPEQALDVKYSEGTVSNLNELLEKFGYEDASVKTMEVAFAEKLARFLTHPVVVPILLSIGSLGLIIELYTPTFGLAGSMGIGALLLFFYGHLVAGLAGMESIILFGVGILLVILELFVAGGIIGILGLGAIITSFFMATDNYVLMGVSLLIAISIAIGGAFVMMKFFGKRLSAFKKIVLNDSMNTESGYVSNQNRKELVGKEGITITPLRPSGTVLVDEEYIDVVTEGSYLGKDVKVKIMKVEGSRIVVRQIPERMI
ncbi:membrane-bound serine protease (ClpP class) [Bacillus iocasae]|uniref:Membrane-bound serine protease (ClpP class) n=2 Tax=Priestia iocasae TaxID=2291674 RepID=A0ABS2QRU7_9BACI|nr:membrane-bound serine protease (ClpP class) [Metabacillus iocasae]